MRWTENKVMANTFQDNPEAEKIHSHKFLVRTGLVTVAIIACSFFAASAAEWEDHTKLHSGKERPHSAFASFPSVEEAKAIRPESCSRRMLLDSETEWRFSYSVRPEDRPKGFEMP